jgi:hypothetical protein
MVVYAQYQRNVKCPQKGIIMSKPDGTGGPKGYGNLSSQTGLIYWVISLFTARWSQTSIISINGCRVPIFMENR